MRTIVTAGAAVLAACGVLGVAPAAAQASSAAVPDWTQQAPAVHPPVRQGASMAYDAATGTVVLFGGFGGVGGNRVLADTWTWDGSTWTQQRPAAHPPLRHDASMAYDAATGTVVLFGGVGGASHNFVFADTWTWDGATWTHQHPATSPPPRDEASMAYDAATGNVVLLHTAIQPGTWTWDGTTWTQQHPATSPSDRCCAAMAYDAATGTVVLFGGLAEGLDYNVIVGDTWTWG